MSAPLRKVVRDFSKQKLRTAIVVISIMVGVFAISGVGTMSATITNTFTNIFTQTNVADITAVTAPTTASLVPQLEGLQNVKGVESRTVYQTRVKYAGSWQATTVVGVKTFASMRVNQIPLKSGAYPHSGQIMLAYSSATVLPAKVGQVLQVQGQKSLKPFTLSGFGIDSSVPPANTSGVAEAFVLESDIRTLSPIRGRNEFLLALKSLDQKDATAKAVQSVLRQHGVTILQFNVRDPNRFAILDTFKTLTQLMTIFGILALVLSGMLVINTMNTIVSEQIPQIGTMKAVGASRSQIAKNYLVLGALYGACGTVLGLILGIIGAYALVQAFAGASGVSVPGLVISPLSILEGVLVGVGVTLVASLLPVWSGSRITVREAISSYGIGTGYKPSRLDQLINALAFLSRPGRLSIRNTFRRRVRLLLTLIPLSLAGCLFVAVGSLAISLNNAVNEASSVNHADLVAQLGQPGAAGSMEQAVSSVSGVTAVEAWYQVPTVVAGQPNVTLSGIPTSTQAYRFLPVDGKSAFNTSGPGNWLLDTKGKTVVVSASFARDNHLQVGDSVSVRAPSGGVQQWRLVGTVKDLNSNGNVAFAPLTEVQALVGAQGNSNYLLITTKEHTASAITATRDRVGNALFPLGVQPRLARVSDLNKQESTQFTVFTVLFYVMVALVSIVGALGLFAVLSMNVVERRKEIGVMRSIGASSKSVIEVFGGEGLMIGLLAFLLGLLVSLPVTAAFTLLIDKALMQIDFYFAPTYIVLMLVFILVIAAVSSIAPAASAARLQIADVLRYG